MSNPHKLLGLEQSASQVELDAAFRRLAKSYHPDRNPEDPEATERFRQLRAAYDVLKSRLDEGPDASSTAGYSPPHDDNYRLRHRRARRIRRAIKRALFEAAIVLSVTMTALLILLYIVWANTQTDWIPGCCS